RRGEARTDVHAGRRRGRAPTVRLRLSEVRLPCATQLRRLRPSARVSGDRDQDRVNGPVQAIVPGAVRHSWHTPLPAGFVAEDVDAAVAFGHEDHAAAVDYDVLGLVDELGRAWAAAVLGVIGDEVPGDVRVVGIADVVDLQAGVEVGEIDVPVVGREAVQALLLVLIVRPEPAALLAEARGVVTARRAGLGE